MKHKDTGKEGVISEKVHYAVAVAVSSRHGDEFEKSPTLKAKAKIADRINGEMNNKTFIEYTEKGPRANGWYIRSTRYYCE